MTCPPNLYHTDLHFIQKYDKEATLFYQEDNHIIGIDADYRYQLKPKNDTIVFTIKKRNRSEIDGQLIDVDLKSKYKRLKSRGCEDLIKNYAKNNTVRILVKMFNDNKTAINDLLYLYLYLYANCVKLKYINVDKPMKRTFNINTPNENLIDDVEDLYNLLYVHFNLL